MTKGAIDFRSGQALGQTVFFDETVDIHHVFPKAWCERHQLAAAQYDTVINKTPLSSRTNRIIGGVAPSDYLKKLEAGRLDGNGQVTEPAIAPDTLNEFLVSHAIPVSELRNDNFHAFIAARQLKLLALVAEATENVMSLTAEKTVEEGEELSESLARDAGISLPDAT